MRPPGVRDQRALVDRLTSRCGCHYSPGRRREHFISGRAVPFLILDARWRRECPARTHGRDGRATSTQSRPDLSRCLVSGCFSIGMRHPRYLNGGDHFSGWTFTSWTGLPQLSTASRPCGLKVTLAIITMSPLPLPCWLSSSSM